MAYPPRTASSARPALEDEAVQAAGGGAPRLGMGRVGAAGAKKVPGPAPPLTSPHRTGNATSHTASSGPAASQSAKYTSRQGPSYDSPRSPIHASTASNAAMICG